MAMNLGISSYCLCRKLYTNEMTMFDILDWAKENGCVHLEICPFGLPLMLEDGKTPNKEFAIQVKEYAEKIGLKLSASSLNACFIRPADEDETVEQKYEKEMERTKAYIEVAYLMGIKNMRVDMCSGQHPLGNNTPEQFEIDLPVFVKAAGELADYLATKGMNLTLENHGLYVNGADRVIRILLGANRPNIGLTVDVGNYLCVDADPVVEVAKAIKYADMVHLKDFYIRSNETMYPQQGMYTNFTSMAKPIRQDGKRKEEEGPRMPRFGYVGTAARNTILRGAIVGQGDMNMWKVLETIKKSGYDKQISLEFEGMEDVVAGTYYGLETARYIWDRV